MLLEISQNSKENTCATVSFLIKFQATSLKKRLWQRCFPVNFVKFPRAPFFTEHLRWLLLLSGTYFCQRDSRYSDEYMLRTNRYAKELGKLTLSTLSSIILCHKRGTHPSKILIGTKTLNTFHSTTPGRCPVLIMNKKYQY